MMKITCDTSPFANGRRGRPIMRNEIVRVRVRND
jgi:hypothetical protein